MPRYLCLVVGTLLLLTLANTQQYEDDLKSLLHDTDVNRSPVGRTSNDDDFEVEFVYPKKRSAGEEEGAPSSESSAIKPAKRLWGVPDTETWVGKAFSHPIPKDAFEGDVKSFDFVDLPPWLWFSSLRNVIEGVPAPSDVGAHYITIVAQGEDGSSAKDAFAVQVANIPESTLLKEARCSPKQDVTMLSINLGKSSDLQPRDKVQMIHTISRLFMTKVKRIYLIPSPLQVDPLAEDNAIMAGPGKLGTVHYSDAGSESTTGQMQLQWSVGCDGEINKEEQDVITNVEHSSRTDHLGKAISVPVLGWIVTQVNPSTKRVRRNVEEDYSGDSIDDEYDYNYEDYFPENNIVGRPVPSLATPVYQGFPASVYPGGVPVSPVFKAIPISTPVYVPIKPTTRIVEASPTVVYKTEYPSGYSETDLESSLLTHPTTSADYTTPLTAMTSVRFGPSRGSSPPIDATSVPDSGGETTEYAVKNFPPRVQTKIQKLGWVAGNVYRVRIPEETFVDVEDGSTRNLTLILKDEGGQVFSRDSWIQFDPSKQEVYALPLEKHIGRYTFKLEAIDKDRDNVVGNFEINVWQHTQARTFHHQFTAVLKMEKKYEYDFAFALDWEVKAVEKIAALFKDDVSHINVRNISTNPVLLSWTNVTLVDSQSTMCPTDELEAIAEIMLSGHSSEPSRQAKRVFLPEFQLKKIHSRFYDPCEPHFNQGRHHTHSETNMHPFTPLEGTGESGGQKNTAPIVRNQIDQLKASVGKLFRYQVPDNTCYDMEDGNSRKLKMQIMTIDLSAPSKYSWLQFDSANQEFFGVPLQADVGKTEYLLECMDKGGKSVSDALIVEVTENASASSPKPVTFSLTFDHSYDAFMSNAYDKVRLMDKLGMAFGDPGADFVYVKSIEKGSVKFQWYNDSLPNSPCPKDEVQRLREIMTNDDGKVKQEFTELFLPDFRVKSGYAVLPSGSCLAGDTPTYQEEPDLAAPEEDEISSPSDEDYLLTFIIPAVIIAFMLLLAALIACCLYRRRRYGKMSMASDRTFVSKGIPIIFAEELDDHRPDNAKSPVIMKEEKPPLPPPEYQRNSPPRSDRQQRPPSAEMNSSEDAPYHRPPPFTASNGGSRNQRPNLPPAYRKLPTYVPP